jgi:hypothetical protein
MRKLIKIIISFMNFQLEFIFKDIISLNLEIKS